MRAVGRPVYSEALLLNDSTVHLCDLGGLNVTLTEEEMKYLEEPYKPLRNIGHL